MPQFKPNSNDVFVDCGAYTGDTLDVFLKETLQDGCKKYYAFEPDPDNYKRLQDYVTDKKLDFVVAINKGVWSHKDSLRFLSAKNTSSSFASEGETIINVDCIDNIEGGSLS